MANGTKCNCARCRCRGLTGPVVLITIGALFLLDHLNPYLGFERTWPVILLAIGAVKIIEAMSSTEGHTNT
jgi:hypothetical protein